MANSNSFNNNLGSAIIKLGLPSSIEVIPRETAAISISKLNLNISSHLQMLSSVTPDVSAAQPVLFITVIPLVHPTAGTSASLFTSAAIARYEQINLQLSNLDEIDEDGPAVEHGAIETARAVIKQLQSKELAPPELSWMGNDAIIMLWALGDTKYALTITDGELGYVVRRAKETVIRRSNINLREFDVLKLR